MIQRKNKAEKLTNYFGRKFKFDLIAGITVAMVAVPQAMAYAAIAGVNPVYGLYTAIIPAIVASIFGSSNHVVTGPTNTIALATAGVLAVVSAKENYPEFVFALAILSGLIMFLLGIFRLGFLIRYVSNSVLTGFLAGAAVLIILNQLPKLLGMKAASGHNLLVIVQHIIKEIQTANLIVFLLGIGGIFILLVLKHAAPGIPSALIVVVVSGILVRLFDWQQQGVLLISEMGEIGFSQMRFHIPLIDTFQDHLGLLVSGALAVALLSLLEAVSVAKSIALQTGQRIDANQEFIGQGLASIIGGFFRGIPTSGSLTRSAVNFGGGAVTRAASGISGVIVLIVLLVFKDVIGYIPVVSLAAIVIVSALHMIDFHHIAITWNGRTISKVVIFITFASVLILPLQISIFLGVGLSIIFYLIESSHLELSYLVLDDRDKFVEKKIEEVFISRPEIAVINVEGPLYFAAVQDLEDQITEMIDAGVKTIILRLRRMHLIASSGISTFELLIKRANEKGGKIRFSGVSKDVFNTLHGCGLESVLSLENIFLATEIPFESTRMAVATLRG